MKTWTTMIAAGALALAGCGGSSSDSSSPGSSTTNYTVAGTLNSLTASGTRTRDGIVSFTTKTISHVMAISPQAANPERFVAAVNSDGSFSLPIRTGSPYVFVFIDSSQTGEDMIVGIFDPGDATTGLDTLVPSTEGGTANLGTVSVNGTSQVAMMSTNFSDFLTALGIDSTTATTIGAVDDLSLRAANPDVDSNGQIDALESSAFWLDFHVRSEMSCTTHCTGGRMSFDALSGSYLTDTASFALAPALTSVYAVYPQTFDTTTLSTYVPTSGVSTALAGGAAWAAADMPGGGTADIDTPATYSYGQFDSKNQIGPDFALGSAGIELPGYDHPVKMTWTLAGGKSMTYSHVHTRAKANFFKLVPDYKVNVDGSGHITSIDYRWMKWTGAAWAAATSAEVQLLVAKTTAKLTFYTVKSGGTEENVSVEIPTTAASGNLVWNSTNATKTSGVSADLTSMKLDDFCSGVSSYDDKLGLRIFAYAFSPTSTSALAACP